MHSQIYRAKTYVFGVKVIKILLRKWKMRFYALQNAQQRMKLASFVVKSGNLLGDSHYKNKTAMNPSYLYNGIVISVRWYVYCVAAQSRSLCISMTCIVFCCQHMAFSQTKWQWIIRDINHSDQHGRLPSASHDIFDPSHPVPINRLMQSIHWGIALSALTFTSINWLKYQRSKSDTFV